MKNNILAIVLILGILVLGFLFIKGNNKTAETVYVPNTEDAAEENNQDDTNLLTTYKGVGLTFKVPKDFSTQQRDSGERSTIIVNDSQGNFKLSILKTRDCDYDVEPGSSPAGCFTNEEFVENFGNRYTPKEQMINSGEVYSPLPELVSEEQVKINFSGTQKQVIKKTATLNGEKAYYYFIESEPFIMIKTSLDIDPNIISSINFSPSEVELNTSTTVR